MSRYEIKYDNKNIVAYQYFGKAENMPKRMRQYFKDKGVTFKPNEMVEVIEYINYEIVKRW